VITAAHIRHATGRQLAVLFGVTPQAVSVWTQGKQHISGLVLSQAEASGLSVPVVMEGLRLRVSDMREARRLRAEVADYIKTREVA
jgi:hypothetical protein